MNYLLIFQMEVISKTQKNTQYTEVTKQNQLQQSQMQNKSITRMVNGHYVQKIFNRFILIQKSYCISLVTQLFLTVLYYQLDYEQKIQKANLILCCLNLLVVPSILLGILSHFSYNDFKISQMKDLQTLNPHQLIFGCIVILIQPYRMLQNINIDNYDMKNYNNVEFKFNYVMVIGSLFKIGLVIPCLFNLLKYKNPRSSRICKIYGCPNSNLYTIKCCFKQHPIILVSFAFLLSFLIFSFAFMVGQRNNQGNASRFHYFSNAIWMVVITMAAVGFGDMTPQTTIGRIIGFVCTICGVLTVSIMVLVVINTFQLDQNQNKSLRLLKKLQEKKQIKTISALYLRLSLWRIWSNSKKRRQDRYSKIEYQSQEEKILKKILKQKIRLSKFTDASVTDLGIEMNRQFQKIQYNVQNLTQNSDQIINYLSTQYFINLQQIREDSRIINSLNSN